MHDASLIMSWFVEYYWLLNCNCRSLEALIENLTNDRNNYYDCQLKMRLIELT